jgi:hypothetical protein
VLGVAVPSQADVGGIDGGGTDGDPQLAVAGLARCPVDDLENVRSSGLGDADGAHGA